MNTRIIDNQTNMSMDLTLYIQAGSQPDKVHGTLNISLSPGELKEITFGNLRNNVLAAMKLSTLPGDLADTYYCRVARQGDEIDSWLNQSDSIDLNLERLQKMESAHPYKTINKASN